MKNIETILSEIGLTVPEDKLEAFRKTFGENYRTVADYDKQGRKLTAAEERASKAERLLAALPKDIDPATFPKLLADAQKAADDAKTEYEGKLAERDFDDALEAALKDVKFTSPGARRDVMAQIKAAGLPVKDKSILGLNDLLAKIRQADKESFVDEQAEQLEAGKAKFTSPTGKGGKDTKPKTREEIMAMPDRAARRRAIAENMELFEPNKEDK